jgi:membrane associated rhomboid family serine protease
MLPIRDRLPRRRFPIVNVLLITLNVLVFLGERSLLLQGMRSDQLLRDFGLVPAFLTSDPLTYGWTVLSSMFMHDPAGWGHLGGNMLFLWIFGDNVEDALGHGRYLGFYLLSGLFATTAQVLMGPGSLVPMVGASGAIAGVLAAYGSLYPRSPITVLNPILPLWLFFGLFFELPAWFVILEFFVVNLFYGVTSLGSAAAGGVAFFAHIGGFVAGLFLVRLFLPKAPPRDHERWSTFRSPSDQRWGLRVRTSRPSAPTPPVRPRYDVPQHPREHRRWD